MDLRAGCGTQPGYDALAAAYDEAFPTGYVSSVERQAIALFAEDLVATGLQGTVVDVGCGTGRVTRDLSARGLEVLGVDPSAGMLGRAQQRYPEMSWALGDASLRGLPQDQPPLAGIVARFSLIHVDPELIPDVFTSWTARLQPGAHVMVAFQCAEDPAEAVMEFDHVVARAWRWHPDAMAAALTEAGIRERWRLVAQPDASNRFATCHLVGHLGA
ncbi:class I SAM-dependent DNA methyltransferase [Nocardioides houyundeii]|uniref:class I SAM-dependent DNA methyltransferase n=1 Tax=Nocardioides houyundeii TaxID=2045452 RepID=UPI0019633270|nr:class I SAM-dependent methyltransferase [Nocardioides houyundeii]